MTQRDPHTGRFVKAESEPSYYDDLAAASKPWPAGAPFTYGERNRWERIPPPFVRAVTHERAGTVYACRTLSFPVDIGWRPFADPYAHHTVAELLDDH